MNRKLMIEKLADHFSVADLKTAVQNLSVTPPTDEGLVLIDAALQIPDDKEDIWYTALAVLCVHDSKLAGLLLQNATTVAGNEGISGLSQTLMQQTIAQTCKLTKADAGRALDATIESIHKSLTIAKLMTFFSMDYLIATVNALNARTPKDDGVDILWAALKLDPAVDALQTWFTALAVISVHNPKLAEAILVQATIMAGGSVQDMNKAELIDAIASGSKLTKADAG